MLKFRLGGDDVLLPAIGVFQVTTQGGIQPLGALLLHHPLTVGGIADEDAFIAGQTHLGGIPILEGNQPIHRCLFGIRHGKGHAFGVVVRGQNVIEALELLVPHLRAHIAPQAQIHPGERLCREPAVHTRGLVAGNQRRLDGNGAAAAETVPQELSAPIVGQHDHGSCQRLPQGGIVAIGTVAPLVQTRAGGIQVQLHPVIHDGKLQLVFQPRLRQPVHAVFFTQPPGSCLLDDGLTVRHAHELAVQAVTLHRESAVLGDEVFQIGAVHPLEQLLEAFGGEIRQHNQHPLAGTQPHIGLDHGSLVTGKQHPTVFHPDVLNAHAFQLVPRQTFQAKQTGYRKFQICHRFSSYINVSFFECNGR